MARLTKNEKRIATVLERLPLAREQIVVAMGEFPPGFDLEAFVAAARSKDAAERNKVAVVERELDLLTNLLEELAARALAEARRLGAVDGDGNHPWEQLASQKVIPRAQAIRLREAKDLRNELDHFYPPTSWRAVHHATKVVVSDLDSYVTRVVDWARGIGLTVAGEPDLV
jgi:uncharacterized protein YutE (UPF0331/DUF86 family)